MSSGSRPTGHGFTLMEVLVVVTIVGTLAAIAIPAFVRQRRAADDGLAKALVRTSQSAMEVFFAEDRTYVGASAATLRAQEPNIGWVDGVVAAAPGNEVGVSGVTAGAYVLATTSRTGTTYAIRRVAGSAAILRCKGSTTCATNEW